jgi:hypothetical protein
MVAETFAAALQSFSRRRPFRPFQVELSSGDRIVVEHPEALAFRAGRAVYISPRGEFALLDHENVTQVTDVSSNGAAG